MENYLGFSSNGEMFENLKSVRKELSDLKNIEHILASCFVVEEMDKIIKSEYSEINSFVLVIDVEESDGFKYLYSKIFLTDEDEVLDSSGITDVLCVQFDREQIDKYIGDENFNILINKETYSKDYLKDSLLKKLLNKEQVKLLDYVQLGKELDVKEIVIKKMKV